MSVEIRDSGLVQEACGHLSAIDSKFKSLIEAFPPPQFTPNENYYQALVRSIIFQQISGRAGQKIFERFVNLFQSSPFPSPELLSTTNVKFIRQAGLSQRKAEYVIGIAEAFSNPKFLDNSVSLMSDEEVSLNLTKIRGVGQWTADMFLIFTLARPDILPVGDHGVKKGMQVFFQLSNLPDNETMYKLTESWMPYRSIACWYMWKIVDEKIQFTANSSIRLNL